SLAPSAVFVTLTGTGLVLGSRSLLVQLLATRSLARKVNMLAVPLTDDLSAMATRHGLDHDAVLVDTPDRFSFAYGLWRPTVAVSRGLVDASSADEIDAVFAHEAYHVRNRDPLKVVFARALPATLFYFPVLGELRRRYAEGKEFAADRHAVALSGRVSLAGAL